MKVEAKMRTDLTHPSGLRSEPIPDAQVDAPEMPKEDKQKEDKDMSESKANPDLQVVASDDEKKDKSDKSDNEEQKKEATSKKKGKKGGKKEVYREPPHCEYNLYLQDDTNADSALFQWYYFSVMNIKAGTIIKINICNLSKPNNLYAKGMKPFVYSMNKFKSDGIGWRRGCD